jgi:hypothetical protein
VLDRRDKALRPYLGKGEARDEWGPSQDQREAVRKWQRWKQRVEAEPTRGRQRRLAERLLKREQDCERVAALFSSADVFPFQILRDAALGSVGTLALNNNYVAGTSGNALSVRYLCPPGGKTINNVYFYISSFTGTAANVDDLNLELRPEASAGAASPDTATLTESKTYNPSSTTGWNKVTGWTSVLSALARVYFIVGDADGGATDFATIATRLAFMDVTSGSQHLCRWLSVTTTGGFASGNSVAGSVVGNMVLTFSDSTVFGNPITGGTAPASDTNRRGLVITTSGLVANVPIFGAVWTVASASISGLEIWTGSNGPSGTASNVSTDILYGAAANRLGCLTSGGTPYTLLAGTQYRIVATYSGAVTSGPQRLDIGTGADGNLYYARANATTDWSNDLISSLPAMGLLVDGQIAAPPVAVLFRPGDQYINETLLV